MTPPGTDVAGVSLTAALATSREKRGEHGVFVAAQSARGCVTYGLVFAKGLRGRVAEDRIAGTLLVHALAEACGVVSSAAEGVRRELSAGEVLQREEASTSEAGAGAGVAGGAAPEGALSALLEGRTAAVELQGGRVAAVGAARPRVLLPGSFNPLHEGHRALLVAACAAAGQAADAGGFELSVRNADKGQLPVPELQRRLAQFVSAPPAAAGGLIPGSGEAGASVAPPPPPSLVLTDAPLFVQKAALLPNTTFVVGIDTALRIVMPKYYGGEEQMKEVLTAIREAGCSFLVAGRLVGGEWMEPKSVQTPAGFEQLFTSLPAFRVDLSSTELREAAKAR